MWIESFQDGRISFEINEYIEAYEQTAIALKNLNNIDQTIEIFKRFISVHINQNPFENLKNLKIA
jgi:hypothetical protein